MDISYLIPHTIALLLSRLISPTVLILSPSCISSSVVLMARLPVVYFALPVLLAFSHM